MREWNNFECYHDNGKTKQWVRKRKLSSGQLIRSHLSISLKKNEINDQCIWSICIKSKVVIFGLGNRTRKYDKNSLDRYPIHVGLMIWKRVKGVEASIATFMKREGFESTCVMLPKTEIPVVEYSLANGYLTRWEFHGEWCFFDN